MKSKIKYLRESANLTQAQLGEILGVSRQAIIAIEKGKFDPSLWLAYEIAVFFEDTIENIFDFEGSIKK